MCDQQTKQDSVLGLPELASKQRTAFCADDCLLPDQSSPWSTALLRPSRPRTRSGRQREQKQKSGGCPAGNHAVRIPWPNRIETAETSSQSWQCREIAILELKRRGSRCVTGKP